MNLFNFFEQSFAIKKSATTFATGRRFERKGILASETTHQSACQLK
jgi:hypothetical protein